MKTSLGSLATEKALVGLRLESISAQQKMVADLPAVARPRYRGKGAINLRDDICLVRLVTAGLADDEINFGHLEAGDRHIEIGLNG